VSCTQCQELAVRFRIKSPSDLWKAICVARDNVADNTISEIPGGNMQPQRGFAEITGIGVWDDFISYRFVCCSCAQQFSLTAETYHGSGGLWQPCST
jgi:hypothetical protein